MFNVVKVVMVFSITPLDLFDDDNPFVLSTHSLQEASVHVPIASSVVPVVPMSSFNYLKMVLVTGQHNLCHEYI